MTLTTRHVGQWRLRQDEDSGWWAETYEGWLRIWFSRYAYAESYIAFRRGMAGGNT